MNKPNKDEFVQLGISRTGNHDIIEKAAKILEDSDEFDEVNTTSAHLTLVDSHKGNFRDEDTELQTEEETQSETEEEANTTEDEETEDQDEETEDEEEKSKGPDEIDDPTEE